MEKKTEDWLEHVVKPSGRGYLSIPVCINLPCGCKPNGGQFMISRTDLGWVCPNGHMVLKIEEEKK